MPTTLEQFLANRHDTSEHRTGIDLFPDHEQSDRLTRLALNAGIRESAVRDVFGWFTGDPRRKIPPEFDFNDWELWVEANKTSRPHIFVQADSYALAAAAFNENGTLNLSARSKLVNEVGEAEAEAMARQWGLQPKGINGKALEDFTTRGTRPDPADVSINAEARKLEAEIAQKQSKLDTLRKAAPTRENSTNPFVLLRDKDTGAIRPDIQKRIEGMIKSLGTSKVAAIAAAAGRRIDGSLIPEKFR